MEDKLGKLIKGRVKLNEPLSRHTSFRIGGPADYWVEPEDLEDLKKVLRFASDNRLPWKVLGRGTNILVRDEGFLGIIINLKGSYFQGLELQGEKVMAGAGILLSRLASELVQQGLRGLEFAVGIPGTLGGAVVMNAGAQGNSLAEIVGRIEILNDQGKVLTLRKEEVGFRYRGSNLAPDKVILQAELALKRGDRRESENLVNKFRERRNIAQPLSEPSAGSIFKNPPGEISAGELIEEAHLKGTRVGAAQISPRHANFIVNRGGARAEDVISLVEKTRKVVRERRGLELELELEIM